MYLDESGLVALWDKIKTMFVSSVNGKTGAVTLGASDVGALDVGGTAASASKLATARTIALTGAVTGSAKFDGSGDVSIVTTGQSAAAQFLAAYPPGSYYFTSDAGFNPGSYGGTWERVVAVGMPITWHRTK